MAGLRPRPFTAVGRLRVPDPSAIGIAGAERGILPPVTERDLIAAGARSVCSLAPSIVGLERLDREREDARRAIERGHFRPEEEQRLREWFARYLTARAGLLETIDELTPLAGEEGGPGHSVRLRAFVVAYAAACLLVRAARFLVGEFATHKVLQRKLNEAVPAFRIPRRQYTRIYRSLTKPGRAWKLSNALDFADRSRAEIDALAGDGVVGPVVAWLRGSEESLRVDTSAYVKARLRYRWHSWRRRRASAAQQALFVVAEAFGRVIADMRNPLHVDRLTPVGRCAFEEVLRPGDVIVTRHDDALTNLFLPGYWPHASLHVGLPSVRDALPIEVDAARAARWVDPLRVLEARKDGVKLRTLDDTLAVDAVVVIRPRLNETEIARAITSALVHEGKLYNFDFDFFGDDRLVCTEVVYRAYEGIGGIEFPLVERSGRKTLSADDIVDLAGEGRSFEAVAVFGTPGSGNRLLRGGAARRALERGR